MFKKQDVATVILGIGLMVLLFTNQFMFQGAARVGAKIGMTAKECLGANYSIFLSMTIILMILILVKQNKEGLNFICGIWASVCFGLVVLFAGQAVHVVDLKTESARISMSIGCYAYLICIFLIEAKCSEYLKKKWKKILVTAIGLFITAWAFLSGQLDGLSVMIEYFNKQSQFQAELVKHLKMSIAVVVAGVIIGVPLGWIAYKKKRVGRVITSILNTLESIPSLALICAMMFPLAFISNHFKRLRMIGFSGVGATPVFFALLFYALFQIVNSMYGALKVVDKQYIEAARGMGMTNVQTFFKIEFPIILPVIISGIRVSLISTILGVTIGAYVGFGGLGMFILQGVTGFAIDIILLVTIPIMMMIFGFDFLLKELVVLIEYVRRTRGMVKI